MSLLHSLLAIFLFVLLSPGILVRLPPKGSKWTVAIVHGVIFAIVMYVVYEFALPNFEGYKGYKAPVTCREGYKHDGTQCVPICNGTSQRWCTNLNKCHDAKVVTFKMCGSLLTDLNGKPI